MSGFAEALKYLYEQWLLRDVLSYITPGAIVTTAATLQFWDLKQLVGFLDSVPLLAYVPIFGALFVTGFGLQNLGEISGVLEWHDRNATIAKDHAQLRMLKQFHLVAGIEQDSDWLERTRERISVKKNMTGTASVALFFALLFFIIGLVVDFFGWPRGVLNWTIIIFTALLVAGLIRGHGRQRKLQKEWEDIVTTI